MKSSDRHPKSERGRSSSSQDAFDEMLRRIRSIAPSVLALYAVTMFAGAMSSQFREFVNWPATHAAAVLTAAAWFVGARTLRASGNGDRPDGGEAALIARGRTARFFFALVIMAVATMSGADIVSILFVGFGVIAVLYDVLDMRIVGGVALMAIASVPVAQQLSGDVRAAWMALYAFEACTITVLAFARRCSP